jgi:hypothetical protein
LWKVDTCTANVCTVDTCTANVCTVDTCTANVCTVDTCTANLCTVDTCTANVYTVDTCTANVCTVDTCTVNMCTVDTCTANICTVDTCTANVCTVDTCTANVCTVDTCTANRHYSVLFICDDSLYCDALFTCAFLYRLRYVLQWSRQSISYCNGNLRMCIAPIFCYICSLFEACLERKHLQTLSALCTVFLDIFYGFSFLMLVNVTGIKPLIF